MFDHSNCGIGAIANLNKVASHDIILQGMTLLKSLSHRGGESSDGTGDGCGILMQIPTDYYERVYEIAKPFAIMMTFVPKESSKRHQAIQKIYEVARTHEFNIIKEIEVAVNESILKPTARKTEPKVMQFVFNMAHKTERELYEMRRDIEKAWQALNLSPTTCYIASCSSQTIVYKGLLTPEELPQYYLDLQDASFTSNFCIVHQRFSTNTNPSWNLAQPFRYLAHNGEINTVSGNVQYSNGRSALASKPNVYPICHNAQSDSANLDATIESLIHEGFNLPNVVSRLLPKAYEQDAQVEQDLRDYYDYVALKQEPWDGPAGVILCDGHKLVATLDRNGLRPFRYVQTDDQIILASEIGVLDTPLEDIKVASRVQASELLVVDLDEAIILKDDEVKSMLASENPYGEWITQKLVEIKPTDEHKQVVEDIASYAKKFQYTKSEVLEELAPLVKHKKEAVGSFSYTAQLQMFQNRVGLLFDYFKQNFAQVTNPPLDSIREQSVFSSRVDFTSVTTLQDEVLTYPIYRFESPIITQSQFEIIMNETSFEPQVISLQFKADLKAALETLQKRVTELLETNCRVIVLDDFGDDLAIPSLLATSVVTRELVAAGRRQDVRLVVKCGDARLPMHYAMLIAYGADLIYPYFAFDFINGTIEEASLTSYLDGCRLSLFKLMAKMGISTISSYRGSQVFELVGLDDELTSYFTSKPSLFGGITLQMLESSLSHKDDLLQVNEYLNTDSAYMTHGYSRSFIKDIKKALDDTNYEAFLTLMLAERNRNINIRDSFEFKQTESISLDLVQSEADIVKQFVAAAMSYGALSIEAHEMIARTFNELSAASNSGEGGELVERLSTPTCSKVKQVASARFGVTYDYLKSAEEIQIKMAQGAKPGEGGHLPKHKVDQYIATVRHAKQGVDLISPPPHHDIYSIEDLAQLIYDVQTTNPQALVSVKLASLSNVGTIANGVVKAGASKVVISGFNSGTGAAAKSSLKYTGLPWEYGLYQTHVSLMENNVRHQTLLQVDGQIKSGHDVIMGAILGADEFGFATMIMVCLDCIGCKLCHSNKCPKGITTQDEHLRQKLYQSTKRLKTYLMFVARQTRELLAKLGLTLLQDLRGRTDLLVVNQPLLKLDWLQPAPLHMNMEVVKPNYCDDQLDANVTNKILSTQRTLGVNLQGDCSQPFKTYGYAGQSFGAFMPLGKTLIHTGYANDYVGKGLSGGCIVVKADKTARTSVEVPLLAGNTILYGATSGTCFIEGRVGERFAVRNSGATSVNHGMGVHACEYMTGGVVVCLGEVSRNIGAGMTGGLIFLYEPTDLEHKLNHAYVQTFEMTTAQVNILKDTLAQYVELTRNTLAANVLRNFEAECENFKLITSPDFYSLSL